MSGFMMKKISPAQAFFSLSREYTQSTRENNSKECQSFFMKTVVIEISRHPLVPEAFCYTAVSTKVVPQKRKSVRDNADLYYG